MKVLGYFIAGIIILSACCLASDIEQQEQELYRAWLIDERTESLRITCSLELIDEEYVAVLIEDLNELGVDGDAICEKIRSSINFESMRNQERLTVSLAAWYENKIDGKIHGVEMTLQSDWKTIEEEAARLGKQDPGFDFEEFQESVLVSRYEHFFDELLVAMTSSPADQNRIDSLTKKLDVAKTMIIEASYEVTLSMVQIRVLKRCLELLYYETDNLDYEKQDNAVSEKISAIKGIVEKEELDFNPEREWRFIRKSLS